MTIDEVKERLQESIRRTNKPLEFLIVTPEERQELLAEGKGNNRYALRFDREGMTGDRKDFTVFGVRIIDNEKGLLRWRNQRSK